MNTVLSATTLLSAILASSSCSAEAAFIATTPSSRNLLPSQNPSTSITSHHNLIPPVASYSTSIISPTSISSSCLLAYKERSRYNNGTRSGSSSTGKRDFDYEYDGASSSSYDYDDDFSTEYNTRQRQQQQGQSRRGEGRVSNSKYEPNNKRSSSSTTTSSTSSTFYSQKTLDDPSFTIAAANTNSKSDNKQFFQELCHAAQITRPSRIQSLAWPHVIQNENCIIADQTGSGKTLSYLIPLLQKLHLLDTTGGRKKRKGCPRIVILTPTAELADQIHSVCTSLSKNLSTTSSWNFHPFVTTATGSHSTNIRDQIRLLQSTNIDILISTPGRLSTILRTKQSKLDLGHVSSLILDEVDFLLVDETFGPQLRTVGVAVSSGSGNENANDDEEDGGIEYGDESSREAAASDGPQFIFVTATLPEDVLESITSEFSNIIQLRGPGLHRITPSVQQTLIDVSVPATSNRDARACFDIKVREMLSALRGRRCNKTLIFCNTVETCRNVENVLRRKDRKGRRSKVWAYHNALSPEVRNKNLQSFSRDDNDDDGGSGSSSTESILVCTDRAARGIDFDASPIDHVLLFDFPKDPAEYVRRVGRTARAGRDGASTVLAYGWQLPIARQIMGLSGGDSKSKNGKKTRGNAVLEAFTMMKSNDGWDDDDDDYDEYYVKDGTRRRKENASSSGSRDRRKKKKKPDRKRQ